VATQVLDIVKQDSEDLVLVAGQLGAQLVLDQLRRSEQRAARGALIDDVSSSFQNLVSGSRQITLLVFTRNREIEKVAT